MKLFGTTLTEHVNRGTTTFATALWIEREDGEVYGFTTFDQDQEIDGVDYLADPGLVASEIVIAADLNVGNLELTTLHDGEIFTLADLIAGRWQNAAFRVFRYDWQNPDDNEQHDDLLSGHFGEITLRASTLAIELRDLRQYLQQPVGDVSQKNCRYRLGDERCMKDISAAPFTVTGTLTHVTSNQVFRDSGRGEAADWFGEGTFEWLTGNNAGLRAKIKSYAADGTFTLMLPRYLEVEVGDTYRAIAGCRKRLEEDCETKFDNALNFGGEPHRRGTDNLTAAPSPTGELSEA